MKKQEIRNQIEKRTMKLFDHLFLNQVKLIEQNEAAAKDLNLKSAELINKLKLLSQHHHQQQHSAEAETETAELIKTINEIKKELNSLHYNYYLATDEKLESILNTVGQLVTNFNYINQGSF